MKAITIATLTDSTCGEACWHAEGGVCNCCCGGKNHGVLRTPNGVQPLRTCKIDGIRYSLFAVGPGKDIIARAHHIQKELPYRDIQTVQTATGPMEYHYTWRLTDPGAPYRLKLITPLQAQNWPELKAFKDLEITKWREISPYAIWKIVE